MWYLAEVWDLSDLMRGGKPWLAVVSYLHPQCSGKVYAAGTKAACEAAKRLMLIERDADV